MEGAPAMSATTAVAKARAASRAGGEALMRYRDDGPLARLLGTLGRALPVPPAALVGRRRGRLVALAAAEGDGASDGLVAAGIGWMVLMGGLSSGRPHTDRFAWAAPGFLRVGEYGGADLDRRERRRLEPRRRFRPDRGRSSSTTTTSSTGLASRATRRRRGGTSSRVAGTGGSCSVGCCSPPVPCRRACSSSRACSASASLSRCALSWARLSVEPLSVYEDEEDEGQ